MKKLIGVLLLMVLAVWIGIGLRQHPGVLVVALWPWRIDMPLWLAVMGLIVFYMVAHYLVRFVSALWHTSEFFQSFSSTYRKNRAKKWTHKGLLAFAQGNWAEAERFLSKGAEHSDIPWFNYVSAAKAAQELGAPDRRDKYLLKAGELPETDMVVGLTQAQLQHQQKQYQQSLSTLTPLLGKAPHHPQLLKLLSETYLQLKDWRHLEILLPQIKQAQLLSAQEYKELEVKVYLQKLQQTDLPLSALQAWWKKLPTAVQQEGDLALAYAKLLQQHHQPADAEAVLRAALKHEWREDLIAYYGQITHPASNKQLTLAENWLQMHPQSPGLLLALGRLCVQMQLWGKAQKYFEASLSLEPSPQAYAELGTLLERMNKPELSAQYFKKGLLLATPDLPLSSNLV